MTENERQAIRRQVQVLLRKRALRSVEGALGDQSLLHEISREFHVPETHELRLLVQSAGNSVSMDLDGDCRRQRFRNLWNRYGNSKAVIIPVLIVLTAIGALIRFDGMTRQSQWLDEYWAVYLSTGRDQLIFHQPYGQVITSPPVCGFVGAPGWWHVWSGIGGVIHPPLFYLTLRGWINLFGESDLSTRGMAAVFSLAAVILLFDVVRRGTGSGWQGMAAAAMMSFSPAQIDFSQQTRPYTMMIFLALVVCDLLVLVEARGPSTGRVILLTVALLALAMTHYFCATAFVAVGLFALIRLRGKTRVAVIVAQVLAVCIMAAVWGEMFWKARGLIALDEYVKGKGVSLWENVINLPQRLLFGISVGSGFWTMCMLAIAVYITPIFRLRRNPQLLLWWLWTICAMGMLLLLDLKKQTHFITVTRYVLLASPGVYGILATPFSTPIGKLVPVAIVIAAMASSFVRWQSGPDAQPDLRTAAHWIKTETASTDVVVLPGGFDDEASFNYYAVSHYNGDWHQPVVLLQDPAGPALLADLRKYPRVWVWGRKVGNVVLPGWRLTPVRVSEWFSLWSAVPDSHQASQ